MQCDDFGIPLIFAEFVSRRSICLLDSATMLSIFQLLQSVVIWLISLSRQGSWKGGLRNRRQTLYEKSDEIKQKRDQNGIALSVYQNSSF